ncbi:hypothetical protein JCM3774_006839 [Rhodotorula dairenensis]
MPTARSATGAALWPAYYPPKLRALSDPRPHREPATRPPSSRYADRSTYQRTLQDDLDDLDNDEDSHYNHVYDLRQYGHAWLIPLGRQRTLDEEFDSQYPSSPNEPTLGDLSFSPPILPSNNINGGGGGGGEHVPGLNLGRPLHHGPQRAGFGPAAATARGRALLDDEADQDQEPVVDLDAEIEDADATRDSDSGDNEDDGDGDDDRPNMRGAGTPTRQRLAQGSRGTNASNDDESMDL